MLLMSVICFCVMTSGVIANNLGAIYWLLGRFGPQMGNITSWEWVHFWFTLQ